MLEKTQNIFTIKIISLSAIMIMTGTILSLSLKKQDQESFRHPFFLVQEILIGELIAIFWFIGPFISNKKELLCTVIRTKEETELKKCDERPSKFWIGIGGIFDSVSSCFQIIGLIFLPTSIYLLIKNGTILFTIFFSVIILKTRLTKKQILGLVLVTIGLALIILSKVLVNSEEKNKTEQIDYKIYFGFFAMIISVIISGFQVVYQEFLFKNYSLDPKEMVGLEGLFGTFIMTVVLICTSFMPCYTSTICQIGKSIDSPSDVMIGILNDQTLLILVYITVSASLIFNVCGATLVKTNSAIFRMMVDIFRSIFTWMMLLFIGQEELEYEAILFQIGGLFFLIAGVSIYNNVFKENGSEKVS